MRAIALGVLVAGAALVSQVEARSYVPLGESAGSAWSTSRVVRSVREDARPFLPGMRPVEVELLEDSLRRKRPITVGASTEKAHDAIVRNALRDSVKRGHIRGEFAEALFLAKNPEWGYVNSRFAPEVDVYRWVDGRPKPLGAQIKTHASPDPAVYARDMVGDRKANLFLVPDNHVEPLREHWRNQVRDFEARSLTAQAMDAKNQLGRVRGLGFTSQELDNSLSRVSRYVIRERGAAYVSLGAGVALAVGPDLWELWQGGDRSSASGFRAARAGSILAAERLTTYALGKASTGALRGSIRGNAIVGMAILATDTGFAIYENGGSGAFRNANFYSELGGSIGGLALGLTVGAPIAGAVTQWTAPFIHGWAPVVGFVAGTAAGLGASAAGYIGGRVTARSILEAADPAFLRDAENSAIQTARKGITASIASLQNNSPHIN